MCLDSSAVRAVILAAGRGSRLGARTSDRPKGMVELRGKPLIAWQIEALRGAGIRDIAIVRGYRAEAISYDATYFQNPRWNETNMVASLAAAEDWLNRYVCLVSYSDIVYTAGTVKKLMKVEADLAITYDPHWLALWSLRFPDPLSDAETFRVDAERAVTEIGGKPGSLGEIQGQYMGLLKFEPAGWRKAGALLNSVAPEARDRMDMTSLLRRLLSSGHAIQGIPIDEKWYEIDSEEDLRLYESFPVLF